MCQILALSVGNIPHRLLHLYRIAYQFKFTLFCKLCHTFHRSRSGSLEVKREQFDYYILRSDELPSVKDNKATIEIISPVLKDARYRWKGIYNKGGETIDFYMCDEDFKKDMFDEKIAFKSGMCIDCVQIGRAHV